MQRQRLLKHKQAKTMFIHYIEVHRFKIFFVSYKKKTKKLHDCGGGDGDLNVREIGGLGSNFAHYLP